MPKKAWVLNYDVDTTQPMSGSLKTVYNQIRAPFLKIGFENSEESMLVLPDGEGVEDKVSQAVKELAKTNGSRYLKKLHLTTPDGELQDLLELVSNPLIKLLSTARRPD